MTSGFAQLLVPIGVVALIAGSIALFKLPGQRPGQGGGAPVIGALLIVVPCAVLSGFGGYWLARIFTDINGIIAATEILFGLSATGILYVLIVRNTHKQSEIP